MSGSQFFHPFLFFFIHIQQYKTLKTLKGSRSKMGGCLRRSVKKSAQNVFSKSRTYKFGTNLQRLWHFQKISAKDLDCRMTSFQAELEAVKLEAMSALTSVASVLKGASTWTRFVQRLIPSSNLVPRLNHSLQIKWEKSPFKKDSIACRTLYFI